VTAFDARTCANALDALLQGFPDEQRGHAAAFLVADLERLYLAAGHGVPPWINGLRFRARSSANESIRPGKEEHPSEPAE
jgi:hypothetical protein